MILRYDTTPRTYLWRLSCDKIKDEIVLSNYLYTCIVPDQYKNEIENYVSLELEARVHYLSQKGLGLSDWNEYFEILKYLQEAK